MRLKEIAMAFYIEAKSDLNAAEILLDKEPSRSVYHSQQGAEKIIKALLALKGKISIKEHEVSTIARNVFLKEIESKDEFLKTMKDASFLEGFGTRSRYPLFGRADKPLWIPSREYKKEDASDGLNKAKGVFSSVLNFMNIYGFSPENEQRGGRND